MDCRKYKNISLLAMGLIAICLLVPIGCRKKTEPASPSVAPPAAVDETNRVAASSPDDERVVRRLADEFVAAFRLDNPTPIERLEEIFADDICQITMAGKIIQGKQNNLFFYRSRRGKNRAELRSNTARYDIRSVKMSRDLAVVFGEVEVERWRKNAPEPSRGSFWETLVFQKIDGKWRLVQEQSTRPKPAKERGEASKDKKPAAEETGRTREHSSRPFVGFGVGVKEASDDTNKPIISDSNDEEQDEAVIPEAEDSNNVTLTAEQVSRFKREMEGSFSGIGVRIEPTDEGIVIKGIIPDGGAEKAGLKSGEVITAIDGRTPIGLTIQQVVAKLTGQTGSKVTLEIKDPSGSSKQVEITRSVITVTGVEFRQLENAIWLLKIFIVNKLTPNEVRKQLAEMKEQNAAGIILDLRGSGGGVIRSQAEISSMFLPKGQIMWLYKPKAGEMERVVNNNEQVTDLPVVVLIDAKADSGELIAAAVKRNQRAKLLGQKTSGFIAARNIIDKPDGTSEAIVIGDFYLTDNERITEVGIEPDIVIDMNLPEEQIIEKCVEELGV